ncbi:MAG: LytTR family transcriptional regulator DNA-binding domain-containing protein [Lachnospiraceae bacterium]|nr:LytTR family transcriptional regulator DNA-binding domain-containing protein [Lachnospiraceae bacterium]
MGKKCLIVLRDLKQREQLQRLISEVKKDCVIYVTDNIKDAYQILLENTIDTFFIEIVLYSDIKGDISGIRLARIIRELSNYIFTPIIFIGAVEDPDKILQTKCCCFDYFHTDYNVDQMKETIKKALDFSTPHIRKDTFIFRNDNKLYAYAVSDIVYIECANRKMSVCLKNKQIMELPYMTCKAVLQNIGDSTLVQCARGVIVNSVYIRSVDKGNKTINLSIDQLCLDLGMKYYKNVIAKFRF